MRGFTQVEPAPWYDGGHMLAPSGTMNLPNGYLGRWCCVCGQVLKRTPSSSEAFEAHLEDLRRKGCCTCCEGLGSCSPCAGPCWDCLGTGCAHADPCTSATLAPESSQEAAPD